MATAKICDRCGGVYGKNTFQESFDENSWGTVRGACVMFEETDKFRKPDKDLYVSGIQSVRKNHYIDLCDKCSEMLCLFLKDKDAKVKPGVIGAEMR